MTALLVAVGGALGALSRFGLERWSVRRMHERMPWGTLIANLLGACLLGVVAGWQARGLISHDVLLLVGTGYCGALTTFSGFMGQVHQRLRHRDTRVLALTYLIGALVAGLVIAGVGYTVIAGA